MFESLSLTASIAVFLAGAAVIGVAGTKLAGFADRFADRTGLGEAITGTIFLGLLTALPGLAASVTAAVEGYPAMAISNAVGGIAVQTAMLAVADIFHTKANLEHAAASAANMMQSCVLLTLIALVLVGLTAPEAAVVHVHPATLLLIVAAGYGFRLVYKTSETPMWRPHRTRDTVEDVPEEGSEREHLPSLVAGLLVAAGITLLAGVIVAEAAGRIVDHTPLNETLVGGLFTGLATSLPEFVTTIAAIRRGALTLAVSDIVGGNFFDVLFVAMADLFYLPGSLFHAEGVGAREVFLTTFTLLLNVILLAGLVHRQRHGPGNIGFESALMLLVYAGGFLVLGLAM